MAYGKAAEQERVDRERCERLPPGIGGGLGRNQLHRVNVSQPCRSFCGATVRSNLRVRFGLNKAPKADLEIHWLSAIVDKIVGVKGKGLELG